MLRLRPPTQFIFVLCLRILRAYIGMAVHSYVMLIDVKPSADLAWPAMAWKSIARPGYILSEINYVVVALPLQFWLEARFPSRKAHKTSKHDLKVMQRLIAAGIVRPAVQWRNVLIKWLLEVVVFHGAIGMIIALTAGRSLSIFNVLPAVRHVFAETWDPVLYVPGYLIVPPAYRLQFRDIGDITMKLLYLLCFTVVDSITPTRVVQIPPLPRGDQLPIPVYIP
ncbi:hypothetical protein AMS68_003915 [Peltaster fructicola]|uniref:Uncharacterized protein n=1 Tax=Peltaster fructicola TaxID=286661 RepID=A0A6H0XUV9_9PEZI|nr:hypothetical protein AMS68_003915 [Peltaster fructicola]